MIQIPTLYSVFFKNKAQNYRDCKIAKKMPLYPFASSLFAQQRRTFLRAPFVFVCSSKTQKKELKGEGNKNNFFVNRIFVPTPEKKERVLHLYKQAGPKKRLSLTRGIDIKKKRRPTQRKIKGRLGKLYISSTKNNTTLTLVDTSGNTKGWASSGSVGFKNARKSTTYAAQGGAESMVKKTKILGITHLRILVKGVGRGKQSCVRALSKSGLRIVSLEDKTGIPHNGCRAPKKRRV
uniref:Ribosomal protein S11 n=1 Tax=Trebouxia lynnae TaxID=1825957 RepID=A0A5J6DTY6_9CHLO|nr:ribosomal protein S11 [Trebouxia lynnae]